MNSKELDKKFNNDKKEKLKNIKLEPNKFKRILKYIWFAISYVWVWCWKELRDWRTFIILLLTMVVVGCEVWVPFILGLIFQNQALLAFAGTMELFWLLPFTPFIPICITITLFIKMLINKKSVDSKK